MASKPTLSYSLRSDAFTFVNMPIFFHQKLSQPQQTKKLHGILCMLLLILATSSPLQASACPDEKDDGTNAHSASQERRGVVFRESPFVSGDASAIVDSGRSDASLEQGIRERLLEDLGLLPTDFSHPPAPQHYYEVARSARVLNSESHEVRNPVTIFHFLANPCQEMEAATLSGSAPPPLSSPLPPLEQEECPEISAEKFVL